MVIYRGPINPFVIIAFGIIGLISGIILSIFRINTTYEFLSPFTIIIPEILGYTVGSGLIIGGLIWYLQEKLILATQKPPEKSKEKLIKMIEKSITKYNEGKMKKAIKY